MKKILTVALSTVFALPAIVGAETSGNGNRYNLERFYHSEISAAQAYLLADDNDRDGAKTRNAVIVDVRSIKEYVQVGHPRRALNIPYPHITTNSTSDPLYVAQDPKTFFDAVAAAIPDRATPIFTLCKTGQRSVLAANILANPGKYIAGYEGVPGYTNVRNVWQGFEGRTKFDASLNGNLDLDNDGSITTADQDGWKYYQGLPYSMDVKRQQTYQPYAAYYRHYAETP